MPLAVAQYLRHLATRCSRMSRDSTDRIVSKELVQISVELIEKAEILEAHFSIAESSGDVDDLLATEIIAVSDDNKS